MHNVDKVGQSATGRLTHSKDKKVINPFPEGVLLLKKVHKQAVYFSQLQKRWENIMDIPDRFRTSVETFMGNGYGIDHQY